MIKNIVEEASDIIVYHEELSVQYEEIVDKIKTEQDKILPQLKDMIDKMTLHEACDFYDGIKHTSMLKFELFKYIKAKKESSR